MSETAELTACVITCSDRVSAGEAIDVSGPVAVDALVQLGCELRESVVVPDDADVIREAVLSSISAGARIVVCSGGTGLSPRDVTADVLTDLAARTIPGIGEAIRAAGRTQTPMADLSRATAVVINDSVVLAVPGSVNGTRSALAVAGPLLKHAVQIIDGGSNHPHQSHATAGERGRARITEYPIDMDRLRDHVRHRTCGAVVSFEGIVRDHDGGRGVVGITYEAHPGAAEVLAQVVESAATLPDVKTTAAEHRVGELRIGDIAFAVAVSAPHRKEAIQACDWLIDEVKRVLPVWKLQHFDDGTQEWSQCP